MRQFIPLMVLGLGAALTQPAVAEDQKHAEVATEQRLDPGLEKYMGKLMPLFFALGDGDGATARKMLEEHMYYPENLQTDSFGGKQVAIDRQVSQFEKWKLDFESVDLMQYKRLSSQGYTVMLVANGNSGPTMFAVTVYRHRDKWQLNEFSFQLVAAQYRATLPNIALSKPITFHKPSDTVAESDKSDSLRR